MFTSEKNQPPFQFQPLAMPTRPMTDDWRKWIAENQLRGCTDESLLTVLLTEGIDANIARAEILAVRDHPYFAAAQSVNRAYQKLTAYHDLRMRLGKLVPNHGQIERRRNLSAPEFLEKYYVTGTPVIVTDLLDNWPAMSRWTPEYFQTNFGDLEVEIQANRNADPLYEINSERHRHKIRMSEYVQMVVGGGETNDYYMVANNCEVNNRVLQAVYDDILMPAYLDPNLLAGRSFFWFGPKGTITPLHHDPANLMMMQVAGRKRWKAISPLQNHWMYNNIGVFSEVDAENPDYGKYPLYHNVQVLEFDLHPGEAIFMPVGWWHHVRSLDICISMSFTNFVFDNGFNFL